MGAKEVVVEQRLKAGEAVHRSESQEPHQQVSASKAHSAQPAAQALTPKVSLQSY